MNEIAEQLRRVFGGLVGGGSPLRIDSPGNRMRHAERMRNALRATVERVDPWDAVEREHRQDVLDWIDSGAPLHRTEKPATPPKHLVSYSLLVDTEAAEVPLIDHRLAGLWLPTGGHVEVDECDPRRRT